MSTRDETAYTRVVLAIGLGIGIGFGFIWGTVRRGSRRCR